MHKESIKENGVIVKEWWEDSYKGDVFGYDCNKYSFDEAYRKFLSDTKLRESNK